MGKKARVAAGPSKENKGGPRRSSKTKSPKKRKASGENQKDENTVPKKMRTSDSENSKPGTSRQGTSDADLPKGQKRGKLPRFLKPELRTIKKTVFDKVKLTASGKPNWALIKEESTKMKKERKERKQTHFEIVLQMKKIWEVVRHDNCPVDKRASELVKLHQLMQTHLKKLVYAHDTSRIVQGLIRLGSPTVRASICDELQPELLEMMQNKFSAFIIKSVLKYGEKQSKMKVVNAMKGHIVKLMTNLASAPLVENVYTQLATQEEKMSMEKEFMGRYLVTVGDAAVGSMPTILKGLNAENKSAVFENIKENINKVVSKGNTCSTLLIQVTLYFVEDCSMGDKQEVLALFIPDILQLIGSKPGSRLGMFCVWYSDKKGKKQIVKKMKGTILNLATSEHSYWIILAILDAIDDTVLLNKIVVSEIATNVTELLKTEYGRKVLGYLIVHRDTRFFHPQDIELLKRGDGFCLKSIDKKREELSPIKYDFLQRIPNETEIWMSDPKIAMVTLAVLQNGDGEKLQEALMAVARYVASDVKYETRPVALDGGMNRIIKKLLNSDQTRTDETEKFAVCLADVLTSETILTWIQSGNYGLFLLIGIMEAKSPESIKTLVSKITQLHVEEICKSTHVGARVLLTHLKNAAPHLGAWESTSKD